MSATSWTTPIEAMGKQERIEFDILVLKTVIRKFKRQKADSLKIMIAEIELEQLQELQLQPA